MISDSGLLFWATLYFVTVVRGIGYISQSTGT